jgi:membrane protein implicated in regulation of membrane protease activity
LKKFIKVDKVKTNLDRVIGMDGIVTEDIIPFELGEVKVDGKKWSAISDEKIEKDSTIVVLDIDGVKLKVKKKEE